MGDGLKRAMKAAKASRAGLGERTERAAAAALRKRPTLYGTPHQGSDGFWYWRITNRRNGNVQGDGGEGYATASACRRAFRALVARIQAGDIELRG